MKNNYYFPHVATFFFLLTVIVALVSWIGSIYGLGTVQSLLSPEGIRWELRHITSNYVKTPALGIIMILLFGLGIASYSGMVNAIGRILKRGKQLTRKEKRALLFSACILFIYFFILSYLKRSFKRQYGNKRGGAGLSAERKKLAIRRACFG